MHIIVVYAFRGVFRFSRRPRGQLQKHSHDTRYTSEYCELTDLEE